MQKSNKFENFLVQDYKLPRYMQKDMQANPLNHGTLQLKLTANIYKFCNIERKPPFQMFLFYYREPVQLEIWT